VTRLVDELNELNHASPQPSNRIFRKAMKMATKIQRQPTTAERLQLTEAPSLG